MQHCWLKADSGRQCFVLGSEDEVVVVDGVTRDALWGWLAGYILLRAESLRHFCNGFKLEKN